MGCMIGFHSAFEGSTRFRAITVALLGMTPTPLCAGISEILSDFRDSEKPGVLVAVHRGGYLNKEGQSFPENSISAMKRSIDAGAAILEVDLAMTSDGQLVIMHDSTLDRTTTGKGPVSALTLAEVKHLFLRDPRGAVTDQRVPTFREVMALAKGRVMVNLDKLRVTHAAHMNEVMNVLRDTGTIDHALFKGSGDPKQVAAALANYPEKLEYMPVLSNATAEKVIDVLDALQPEAIEIVFKSSPTPMLSPEVLATAKRHGTRIWINSLWGSLNGGHHDAVALAGDPQHSWGWIVQQGATIIQTDHGVELLRFLESTEKSALSLSPTAP
jgi:glycerophosphoryl diester phosphodiesterase